MSRQQQAPAIWRLPRHCHKVKIQPLTGKAFCHFSHRPAVARVLAESADYKVSAHDLELIIQEAEYRGLQIVDNRVLTPE